MITIPSDRLIVFDSCVAIELQRGKATGLAIEATYNLKARVERPLLSSVVEGEVFALAKKWKWGAQKLAQLQTNFGEMVRVPAGAVEIVEAYADIYATQESIGKRIGENDTWIAATARAIGGVVLTTDGDFLKLQPGLVDVAHFNVENKSPTS